MEQSLGISSLSNTSLIMAALIGIGLSAAAGFRVFVPLWIASLAIFFSWIPQGWVNLETSRWLGSSFAVIALGVATLVEIISYKIPYVDNLLDTVMGPLAVLAGMLLSSSFFVGVDEPFLRYGLGLIAGGASATLVQGTTTLLRAGSTKLTGGITNPILSFIEAISAFSLSTIAIFFPIIAMTLLFLMILVVYFLIKKLKRYF